MEAIEFIEKEIEYLKIKNAKARLKCLNEERIKEFENVLINLRKGKSLMDKALENPLWKDPLVIETTTPIDYKKKFEGVIIDDERLHKKIEIAFLHNKEDVISNTKKIHSLNINLDGCIRVTDEQLDKLNNDYQAVGWANVAKKEIKRLFYPYISTTLIFYF